MYQHIAVPLDGSHNAQLALNEALKLVKTFNAKLTLINVIDDKRLIYSVTSTGIAHTGGYYEELTTHAKDVLAEGQAIAAKQGITAETAILHGNPKQVIAEDFPHDHKVDLIVMGKSGTDAWTAYSLVQPRPVSFGPPKQTSSLLRKHNNYF
ncbi:universal stress protein [Secundilactobacillus similis]|uniref:universal stress protein n=1 Tax=Secundilactobacillus similis TaxID=414682 RepID=UPI00138F6586|nr:universal stress protein [Secundilactobacillus similis]